MRVVAAYTLFLLGFGSVIAHGQSRPPTESLNNPAEFVRQWNDLASELTPAAIDVRRNELAVMTSSEIDTLAEFLIVCSNNIIWKLEGRCGEAADRFALRHKYRDSATRFVTNYMSILFAVELRQQSDSASTIADANKLIGLAARYKGQLRRELEREYERRALGR